MASTPVLGAAITRTPGVMGGSPCIDGTRLRVADIVLVRRYEQLSSQEIADSYDRPLTAVQVEAALAYYEANRREIDEYIAAEDAVLDDLIAKGIVRVA